MVYFLTKVIKLVRKVQFIKRTIPSQNTVHSVRGIGPGTANKACCKHRQVFGPHEDVTLMGVTKKEKRKKERNYPPLPQISYLPSAVSAAKKINKCCERKQCDWGRLSIFSLPKFYIIIFVLLEGACTRQRKRNTERRHGHTAILLLHFSILSAHASHAKLVFQAAWARMA